MSHREPLSPISSNNVTPTPKRPTPVSKFVSPSTSRHAHIPTPVGVFTKEHDDAAERRDRRRSRVLELQRKAGGSGSPGSPDRGRSTPLNGLTANQLSDHYASCIKLSTENKINAKNAFGLHLIDYMADLLRKKELESFQVASTTLDASAKIYAGRVDFIHSETYKVLTGLGRGSEKNMNKNEVDGDENSDDLSIEDNSKKKRKARKSRTIETNLKNINVNKFDLEFEVDPMFQVTSAAFDEGGVSGLLLNSLQCFDDGQQLILDSSTQVSIIDDKNLLERISQPMDTEEIIELLAKMNLDHRQICPQFQDFRFSEWDDSDVSSIIPKPLSEHVFDVNAEIEPIPEDEFCSEQGLSYNAGDSDDEHHGFDGPGLQEETMSTILGDNQTAKLVESAFRDLTHGSVGSLMQILSTEPSDYSYFDKTLLKSWAGPSHWKLGPLSKDSKNVTKSQKLKKVDFKIDYDADIDIDKPFRKSKATTLTKATLTKHNKNQTTLPEDQHYNADQLFRLFIKPKIMIKRQTASDVGVDDAVDNYDYNNANDKDNYCPADIADDDEDDDHGFNYTAAGGDYSQESAEITVSPTSQDTICNGTILSGDKLLAQPYKVAKIDIGYAKTAKKLDVRKLKGSMWKLLTTAEQTTDEVLEKDEDLKMNTSWSFQSLLEKLPEKVSTNTAKNLSIPIAFVCLLHLANEKSLKITGEHLMDLLICKGDNGEGDS